MGEHYLFRKAYPYNGSIHIHSFIYDPANLIAADNHKIKSLVKIQDVFPSIVDLVLDKKIKTDGRSVKQLLFGDYEGWRTSFHGEHSLGIDSSQYIMTDNYKFIWFPVRDEYQLFDIQNDMNEQNNLISIPKYKPVILELTNKLIDCLKNREEDFVVENRLTKVPLEKIVSTLKFAKNNIGK